MDSWFDACKKKGLEDVDPSIDELKRIKERTSQFRGQLKDNTQVLVAKMFGLIDPMTLAEPTAEQLEATLEHNRAIVTAHQKNKFWYKDPENPNLANSMFRAAIIQQVFNINWFGSGTYNRASYFAGETETPLVTIALIMDAVDCSVDSWSTGRYVLTAFSAVKYGPRYRRLLERLQEWKAFTVKEQVDLAQVLQEDLLRNARAAAGLVLEAPGVGEESDEESMLAAFRANQGTRN
ncbi:hypothetical protein GALMADRAFT_145972 [Galerina marginata CBS 339.88]|uniref:DUF6532 domain-containing protein n=1 Tax=Galerina marginata (strain CBS 339.88) TaxID=685588 RepID=A0A067SDH4_GALM3|nr:hypothetical protein GALMADRAFT_145972 [Galerina marginata CBS 339.88]